MTYFYTRITLDLIGTFFSSFGIRNHILDYVTFLQYATYASVRWYQSQWPSIDCHVTNGSQDGVVDMLTIRAVKCIFESRTE